MMAIIFLWWILDCPSHAVGIELIAGGIGLASTRAATASRRN